MDFARPASTMDDHSEAPKVTLHFAETEDEGLIDTVLGMLLQSFSK